MKKGILLLALLLPLVHLSAQKLLEPAVNYRGGELVLAPEHGIEFKIPEGWTGYLLRGSGMFRMDCDTVEASMLCFTHHRALTEIKEEWKKGLELAPGIDIKLSDSISQGDQYIYALVHSTGSAKSKGYIMSKCGEYEQCISALFFTPERLFLTFENQQESLLDAVSFRPAVQRIETFDWRKNLSGKMIFTLERVGHSSKDDRVWLYYDGSFKSKVKRSGIFKNSAGKYNGTQKGSYQIVNAKDNQPARLILEFKKLPALTFDLSIKDHQYYLNDELFFFDEINK